MTLKWRAKESAGPYRQTAVIRSNDPGRPEVVLAVKGEMTLSVRADPPELIFSNVPPGKTITAELRLWCGLKGPPLEIRAAELSDAQSAQFFEIAHEPISAAAVERERGVASGVLLRVSAKPGLPRGPFQQTILLRTNLDSVPTVTVPLRGVRGDDVSATGPGWDAEHGVLHFGSVSRRSGAQRRLVLTVHGPRCKEVEFKPVRVVPDFLQVLVGEVTPIGSGSIVQVPVIVEIPASAPPENHLGSEEGRYGEILLETSRPEPRALRIYVRFAVEGDD